MSALFLPGLLTVFWYVAFVIAFGAAGLAVMMLLVPGLPGQLWRVLFRETREGERFRTGYGVAWLCYDRRVAMTMPIPLNLLGRVLRGAWLWCLQGGRSVPSDAREAYAQGVKDERARWRSYIEDPLG